MLLAYLVACAPDADPPDEGGPAALEAACDGLDDDGDGEVDEGLTSTWYLDGDRDGWGAEAVQACDAPTDGVTRGGDCDDGDAAVSPEATERCDGRDDDCDGLVDPTGADGCVDAWWDLDGDGLGGGEPTCVCDVVEGMVRTGGDCDPQESWRGADCTEGEIRGLGGARILDDLDAADWGPVGKGDLATTDGEELLMEGGDVLRVVAIPTSGDVTLTAATLGAPEAAGYSLALGDVDGDGWADLSGDTTTGEPDPSDWTGSTSWITPTVSLFRGPLADGATTAWTTTLDTLHISFHNAVHGSHFIDDLDGDGVPEVWYGYAGYPDLGLWRIDAAGTALRVAQEDYANGDATAFTPLGDVDGDGLGDLAVSVAGYTVSVHLGPILDTLPPGSEAAGTLDADDVAMALGDVDGDGRADLATGGVDSVWVITAPLSSGSVADIARVQLVPEHSDGTSLHVVTGDVGADGSWDLVVTDPYLGESSGVVYVFHALPSGVVDLRAADTRVYGDALQYNWFAAATVLSDGRLVATDRGGYDREPITWLLEGM